MTQSKQVHTANALSKSLKIKKKQIKKCENMRVIGVLSGWVGARGRELKAVAPENGPARAPAGCSVGQSQRHQYAKKKKKKNKQQQQVFLNEKSMMAFSLTYLFNHPCLLLSYTRHWLGGCSALGGGTPPPRHPNICPEGPWRSPVSGLASAEFGFPLSPTTSN
jgi:hypothetical protein